VHRCHLAIRALLLVVCPFRLTVSDHQRPQMPAACGAAREGPYRRRKRRADRYLGPALRMTGPLVLGIVGAAIVVLALVLQFTRIHPDRPEYQVGASTTTPTTLDRTVIPPQPGLRRMVIDQGRFTLLAAVGSAFQLVALVWQASR
jgi:hypothetical protein